LTKVLRKTGDATKLKATAERTFGTDVTQHQTPPAKTIFIITFVMRLVLVIPREFRKPAQQYTKDRYS